MAVRLRVAPNFQEAKFPSLHQRKEGWPRDKEDAAKPPKTARTGWFSALGDTLESVPMENHPVGVLFGRFAIFSIGRRYPALL